MSSASPANSRPVSESNESEKEPVPSSDPIINLISTYHSLNAATIVEFHDEEPSALEFMRFVAMNRPFVARRAAMDWPAVQNWDADYLEDVLQGEKVRVAVTPYGNADSVADDADGRLVFVEPYETHEEFGDFLRYLREDSLRTDDADDVKKGRCARREKRNVKYAQSQNSNLPSEYAALQADVPASIPFARIALQRPPDAINVWIGNARARTALHKDPYENIYVQVRGRKHFVLMPGVEQACVNEAMVPRGRYAPASAPADDQVPRQAGGLSEYDDGDDDDGFGTDAGTANLVIVPADGDGYDEIPVALWNPDQPSQRARMPYSALARPMRVTLDPGDMLYLPALWYHSVSQSGGEEGFACAVNYWYDMEYGGTFWASHGFLREVVGMGGVA